MIRFSLSIMTVAVLGNFSYAQVSHPSSSKQQARPGATSSAPAPASDTTHSAANLPGFGSNEIVDGLKEALNVSAINSANLLSAKDGFFKNQAIKILLPPDVKMVESKLRSIGLGSEVDKALLSMNRAAEEAAKDAAPIFINAIKGMSVNDAIGLVTGPKDAATQYLKKTTTAQLTQQFTPVISKALDKTEATKYWEDVFGTYNKLPFVQPVNPDLEKYVTEKALDGLFYTMAIEEAKIRKDPAGTANSLIESVFGKH